MDLNIKPLLREAIDKCNRLSDAHNEVLSSNPNLPTSDFGRAEEVGQITSIRVNLFAALCEVEQLRRIQLMDMNLSDALRFDLEKQLNESVRRRTALAKHFVEQELELLDATM